MRLTRTELKTLLETLTYDNAPVQVFYNHTTRDDVVNFPYIVFLDYESQNMFSDNKTLVEIIPYSIYLHSAERLDTLETSIKELLSSNSIAYEIDEPEWDEELLMWVVGFQITL